MNFQINAEEGNAVHAKLGSICILTALGALGVCAPGFADQQSTSAHRAPAPMDQRPVPSVVVRYGDLDASTDSGARALYRRLQTAAWLACANSGPMTGIESVQCRQTALDNAVTDVNSPALTALHTGGNVERKAMLARRRNGGGVRR